MRLVASEERGRYGPAPADANPHGHDGAALEGTVWPPAGGEGAPVTLQAALTQLQAAIDAFDDVDVSRESDDAVRSAAVTLPGQIARAQSRLTAVIGEVDVRQAYEVDGAVSTQSWYRARVHCNPGEATQLVTASRRLRFLPRLAAAFGDGKVGLAHTAAITTAATPQRLAAIKDVEDPLVDLAEQASPRDVRTAVAFVRDAVDPDGSDAEPLPDAGPDPRRGLTVRPSIDGLAELDGTLDPVTAEWLRTLLDAFHQHDGPDAPPDQRRTPAQRRHDAFHDLLTKVAAHPETPHLQSAKPHVLVMVDVEHLAGDAEQTTVPPAMRDTGEITPELARQLAQEARVTAVQTMGPWRPVSVGRSQRGLPAWLRDVMHMLHPTCCGPDCDRPATWTEAHHVDEWDHGGHTDLDRSIPVCKPHHDLLSHGGWTVELDPASRTCTWTSPVGQAFEVRPPPRSKPRVLRR